VSGKPFFIISDLHLGAVPETTERAFLDFLAYTQRNASGLLINGDLFDVWVEYRSVVPRRYVRVLYRLTEVVEGGLPVFFVGGNHDAVEWAGDVLSKDVGLTLLQDPVTMDLAGRRTLIVHGDAVGPGDLGYRILRRTLRSRAVIAAARTLHPDWLDRITRASSKTKNKVAQTAPAAGGLKHSGPRIEAWARDQLLTDQSLDLVVAGHAHQPAKVEVTPGRYYVNSGDWIHHWTYVSLSVEGGPPRVLRWPTQEELFPT
jgi:UDP-2,3-diacylglucosamine hydrolase